MDEDIPQPLKIASIVQIVAGVLNIFGGWFLGQCVIGGVCGTLTLFFGGQICGMVSCLLVPLGLVEIGIGAYTLAKPRDAAGIQKIVSFVEIGSILVGGLGSMVAGIAVFVLHGQDETVTFLEG